MLEEPSFDDIPELTKGMTNFDSSDRKLDKIQKENLLDLTEPNISMKVNANDVSIQNTSYNYRNTDSMAMNTNLSPINNLNQTNLEEEATILETNQITETEDANF